MSIFHTEKPLIVTGSTGMLGSQFVFFALEDRFSPHIVLHGSNLSRLEGLREEIYDAGLAIDVRVTITTDIREACSYGGYMLYSRSVRSENTKSREEMLLDNAPAAQETGLALRDTENTIERIVCVSNPSDLIGLSLLVNSGLSPDRICSLSALDTTRYIKYLSRELSCHWHDLSGVMTLGSHDQSMAVLRDTVRLGSLSIDELISMGRLTEASYATVIHNVVMGGVNIIKLRGHTSYQSPAYLCYEMLKASDDKPFRFPTASYHHSSLFPYGYMALPSVIDSSGTHHQHLSISRRDLEALSRSYLSIKEMRDMLITHGYLPPIEEWHSLLHEMVDLVSILD